VADAQLIRGSGAGAGRAGGHPPSRGALWTELS
jgi:hypothetical protein